MNKIICKCWQSKTKSNPNWIAYEMLDRNDFCKLTQDIAKEYGLDIPPQFNVDDDYLYVGQCDKCGEYWNGDVEYKEHLHTELSNWDNGNELILEFHEVK